MIRKLCKNLNVNFRELLLIYIKCFFLASAATGLSLIFPWLLGQIVNVLNRSKNINILIFYITCMIVSGLLSIVLQYIQTMILYRHIQKILLDIKKQIFTILLKTNLNFWIKRNIGDVIAIFQHDIPMLENFLITFLRQIFVNIIVLVGLGIFILNIDFEIGTITMIFTLLFVFIQKKIGKKIQKSMIFLRNEMGELESFSNETINNIVDIQCLGYENVYEKKFLIRNTNYIKEVLKQEKLKLASNAIGNLNNTLNICLALGLGTIKVLQGNLDIGELFTLSIYVQRLYNPIINLINAYITVKKTFPILDKIMDIFNTDDVIKYGTYIGNADEYKIHIKNVCFSYDEKNVLNNVNFTIENGEIIGIVGENGSGKTTLCRLLMRLCDCQEGEIRINNRKIEAYDLNYLRKIIGYLPQKCYIGNGTITEILDPLENCYSKSKLIEVMHEVGLEDYYFNNVNRKINENKNQISGGEAQRILLARIILEDKPIVILDEPTSAMDMDSEKDICRILKSYLKNKISIIITHRVEILNICTRVIDIADIQHR